MKTLLILVAALATTFGTAAAQRAPSAANGPARPTASTSAPADKAGSKVVVSSGGQGHNSGPDPKGKTLVAPSTSQSKGKRTAPSGASPAGVR